VIPGAFAYHRPQTLNEAVTLLSDLGDDARPLAGGHSLIPMMKLRLATPDHLIDLRAIGDLKGVRAVGGDIVIGAMTTQHEVIASELLTAKIPILRETSLLIADPQVRYVGTLGGNVANGDPGNDMPAVMMCLGAVYHAVGKAGERRIAAREFYRGVYSTALEPGEIVSQIRIPVPAAGHGHAYQKLKRKVGDYATAAAAVVLTRSGGKIVDRPHQCGRNSAVGRGGGPAAGRLGAGTRGGQTSRRRRRGDHRAGHRQSRACRLPHQDGGRDAGARPRPRRRPRRVTFRERSAWPPKARCKSR
jgi:aerobic carbon-monoxide dehydrogenase medium subunit